MRPLLLRLLLKLLLRSWALRREACDEGELIVGEERSHAAGGGGALIEGGGGCAMPRALQSWRRVHTAAAAAELRAGVIGGGARTGARPPSRLALALDFPRQSSLVPRLPVVQGEDPDVSEEARGLAEAQLPDVGVHSRVPATRVRDEAEGRRLGI